MEYYTKQFYSKFFSNQVAVVLSILAFAFLVVFMSIWLLAVMPILFMLISWIIGIINYAKATPAERAKANQITQQKHEIQQEQKQIEMSTCPYCHSNDIQPLGSHRKDFSVGKAVGGALLAGGTGALIGFLGKKSNKTDWVCLNCGQNFTR